MTSSHLLGASFRDPNGFMFFRQGTLYRQVNQIYRQNYDLLASSGLYNELTDKGFLIPHQEVKVKPADPSVAYKVLRPEIIPFISYPYEWSFSQLKDAALTTLAIQKRALRKGLSLKDSSAYNIQFRNGRPVLIDTLSFEEYREGEPWIAYRQFCQHFVAPLALMAHKDVRLNQLLRVYIDGIPLNLASRLLPGRTRLNLGLSTHVHLHATLQRSSATKGVDQSKRTSRMSRAAFEGLIDNLRSLVRGLAWKPTGTEWGNYYDESADHYSEEAFNLKKKMVAKFINEISPRNVWDLGANTGIFSRIASSLGIPTVAFDIDPAAVERNYMTCKTDKDKNLLPLLLDLTNPSPSIGWSNAERLSLLQRGPVDAILALALVHHLAIANNVPLIRLAEFFHEICHWLVIEFVPKRDSQVQILLASRQDIFPDYSAEGFESAFKQFFVIREALPIPSTQRVLYLMKAR